MPSIMSETTSTSLKPPFVSFHGGERRRNSRDGVLDGIDAVQNTVSFVLNTIDDVPNACVPFETPSIPLKPQRCCKSRISHFAASVAKHAIVMPLTPEQLAALRQDYSKTVSIGKI